MRIILIFLVSCTLMSCSPTGIDASGDLWATSPIYNQDSTLLIGCRVTAFKGRHFDGIIPTSVDGTKILEIKSLTHAKSILPHPKDTSLTTIDCTNAHYLKTIGDDAFYGISHLRKIILNDGLERLENGAFADCRNIENIVWNKEINFLGEAVFYNCDKLITLIIPEKVDSISAFAFYASENIENVIFNSRVNYIGERAFANCTKVKAINLPKSLTFIGKKAFLNHGQVSTLTIPENVVEIDDQAFFNCRNLSELTVKNKTGTIIGPKTFQSAPINISEQAVIYHPKGTNYPEMEHWKSFKAKWRAQ